MRFLTAALLAAVGCYGGSVGHTYQAAESEGRLSLRWRHVWKPVQVVIERESDLPHFEELNLELTGPAIDDVLTLGTDKAAARWDHGRLHPCDGPHDIQGTVRVMKRTAKEVRAHVNVDLSCGRDKPKRFNWICDFEIKPYLPQR